ncbi:hypothetical protein ANN_18446 [Periplaneta americana]|uniref:Uncharacterized protein n=1 Tax=Periplaneta americana TaxID=6978 RepID=A0ABQ8SQ47_PERAM|nr:hypothetical protein ANN_18446 [Periplaneta americana]
MIHGALLVTLVALAVIVSARTMLLQEMVEHSVDEDDAAAAAALLQPDLGTSDRYASYRDPFLGGWTSIIRSQKHLKDAAETGDKLKKKWTGHVMRLNANQWTHIYDLGPKDWQTQRWKTEDKTFSARLFSAVCPCGTISLGWKGGHMKRDSITQHGLLKRGGQIALCSALLSSGGPPSSGKVSVHKMRETGRSNV